MKLKTLKFNFKIVLVLTIALIVCCEAGRGGGRSSSGGSHGSSGGRSRSSSFGSHSSGRSHSISHSEMGVHSFGSSGGPNRQSSDGGAGGGSSGGFRSWFFGSKPKEEVDYKTLSSKYYTQFPIDKNVATNQKTGFMLP